MIDSLLHTMRADSAIVVRLHRFRRIRNEMTYERVGTVTQPDAAAFLTLVGEMRASLVAWLAAEYPLLRPTG